MLRRTNSPAPKQDPSELQGNGSQSSLSALLTEEGKPAVHLVKEKPLAQAK